MWMFGSPVFFPASAVRRPPATRPLSPLVRARVDRVRGEPVATAARLNGEYVVTFKNGTRLPIRSEGELELLTAPHAVIQGRFALEDYVARVVDREGDASVAHAARALAVLARSYALQNGAFESGCYRIADSSGTQRVNARPPSLAARQAAQFTAGLVLSGAAARYHRDQAAPGRLAWKQAVEQAHAGASFDELLMQAFPNATLANLSGLEECKRLDAAERWLAAQQPKWQRVLLIDGVPVPFALARIPQGSEIRGNLAVGGKGVAQPLSARDREIAERLGPVLAARGLLLVGLDVIGDWVTEINVTSPTGFQEIAQQSGFDVATMFVEGLERAIHTKQ